MSRYDLVINGSSYQVDIRSITGTEATVSVNGVTYQVEIPAGAAPLSVATPATPVAPRPAPAAVAPAPNAPPPSAPAAPEGGEVLTAPMPGHILSVSTAVGDVVDVGDTVVIMEAMKMENEIKAHVAGTVLEVKVAKGSDVGVGDVLIVIGAG